MHGDVEMQGPYQDMRYRQSVHGVTCIDATPMRKHSIMPSFVITRTLECMFRGQEREDLACGRLEKGFNVLLLGIKFKVLAIL